MDEIHKKEHTPYIPSKHAQSRIDNNYKRIHLTNDASLIDKLSITRSPRELNDYGNKVFQEYGCSETYNQYKELFLAKLEERAPKTALDVETEAHSVMLSLSDNEYFNKIKSFIFNKPKLDGFNIDLSIICFVMGFYLRNDYLKLHPEII